MGSHRTTPLGGVFGLINPEEFRCSFLAWVQTLHRLTKGEVVAIDRKQLHGSVDEGHGQAALDMVSAWATVNQLVLGQVKVEDKSNEIPAIPRLLELLDITGCLVTIDAIGTQTEIAKTIVDRGGEYLLPVKENQGHLYGDMERLFGIEEQEGFPTPGYTYARQVDANHGRLEIRECWATSSAECLDY
jgi:predicted transposase YbfD/YdcC